MKFPLLGMTEQHTGIEAFLPCSTTWGHWAGNHSQDGTLILGGAWGGERGMREGRLGMERDVDLTEGKRVLYRMEEEGRGQVRHGGQVTLLVLAYCCTHSLLQILCDQLGDA